MVERSMKASLIVENARTENGEAIDIVVFDDTIVAVGADAGSNAAPTVPRFDATGGLLISPFVDGHVHLDKTFIGLPFIPHVPGETVGARIEAEKSLRRSLRHSVEECGGRLIEK